MYTNKLCIIALSLILFTFLSTLPACNNKDISKTSDNSNIIQESSTFGTAGSGDKSNNSKSKFYAGELEATRQPVRPGEPGKRPFWNVFTKRFMYAPAFDFSTVPDAAAYKFTAVSEDGKSHTFTADVPWAPLSPIWDNIVPGAVTLKVEGLGKAGEVKGKAGERTFYRSAIFNGPYRNPAITYTEAGKRGLRALLVQPQFQYWLTQGKPDPSEQLNCYPSKEMGASIRGMVAYSKVTENKQEAEDALKVARNIADFMLKNTTVPEGQLMEDVPLVYWLNPDSTVKKETKSAVERVDYMMLSEPTRALLAYMDLFDATGDKKYLDAAVKAARTYVKIRRPDGTWPVMIEIDTGKEIESKPITPTWLMFTFNRLSKQYGLNEFAKYAADTEKWIMDNPAANFNWDAQFEDIQIREMYRNMSYEQASDMSWYLLSNFPDNKEKVALAEELLRFVEDQFAVWEKPKDSWFSKLQMPGGKSADNKQTKYWVTPSIIEQHTFFVVSRATSFVMRSYGKAYEVTGKEIYLAKAQSLANTLLEIQKIHGGGEIPTFPMTTKNIIWTNNSVYTAMFLIDLDVDIGKRK